MQRRNLYKRLCSIVPNICLVTLDLHLLSYLCYKILDLFSEQQVTAKQVLHYITAMLVLLKTEFQETWL